MISEADYENLRQYKRDRAVQAWSFGVAVPIALLIWMLASWRLLLHLTGIGDQKPEQITEIVSTSIDVRPHDKAVPEQHAAPAAKHLTVQPHPQAAAPVHAMPHPQSQPVEIARITPHAPPVPRNAHMRTSAASLSSQLAQQEAQFSREAQQLNASHSAVSVATADPNAHDAETTVYKAAFAGNALLQGHGNGYIYPIREWTQNGLHCYYGRYTWIYPTGGSETANIPWPFCFDRSDDPFERNYHEIPMPLPMTGFRIPAGTQLQPIEQRVYDWWLNSGG